MIVPTLFVGVGKYFIVTNKQVSPCKFSGFPLKADFGDVLWNKYVLLVFSLFAVGQQNSQRIEIGIIRTPFYALFLSRLLYP